MLDKKTIIDIMQTTQNKRPLWEILKLWVCEMRTKGFSIKDIVLMLNKEVEMEVFKYNTLHYYIVKYPCDKSIKTNVSKEKTLETEEIKESKMGVINLEDFMNNI